MITNNRWFSPHGFFIDISPEIHIVNGKFFLPVHLASVAFEWNGISLENEENYDLAFIINWEIKRSNSYTAFNGKINNEGNLLLDWLLSSEDLNSNKITNTPGSSILTKHNPELKPKHLESQPFPYPSELQYTPVPTNLLQLNKSALFQ